MKYKSLFRLSMKFLGVYFFGFGVLNLATNISYLVYELSRQGALANPLISQFSWYRLSEIVIHAGECAFGLYLFFDGKWIVDKAIPSNRLYCQECGYDLAGAARDLCPECGTPFKMEDAISQTADGEDDSKASSSDDQT